MKEAVIKTKHDVNAGVVVALEAPLSHLLHPGKPSRSFFFIIKSDLIKYDDFKATRLLNNN